MSDPVPHSAGGPSSGDGYAGPAYAGPLPEWAPHMAMWIGFPSIPAEWGRAFPFAQAQIADCAAALADERRGEAVYIVCNTDRDAAQAHALLDEDYSQSVTVITEPIGDAWLRDTGPIICGSGEDRVARRFGFNGWGGKYLMPGDADVGARLATRFRFDLVTSDLVLEGGAIDWDGAGLAVTTEQCLLNPNRNPGMGRAEIEAVLAETLGFRRLLWLGDGLANDHTDGHVDNLARFVAPGVLLLPTASGDDDPNAAVYADAMRRAEAFGIDILTLPSPGRIELDGRVVPASYMNFLIGNTVVVMPAFGVPQDDAAAKVLADCFPDRRIVPLPTDEILRGGGSFHCISQQMPR